MKTICIMCPMGCPLDIEEKKSEKSIEVTKADGTKTNITITGNTCKRGFDYAKSEYTMPVRMVTSLVKINKGGVLACKTTKPVAKSKIKDILLRLKDFELQKAQPIGSVIINNIDNEGADIIITSELE